MEAAAKQSKQLKGAAEHGAPVLVVDTRGPARSCGRCGRGNHALEVWQIAVKLCFEGEICHILPQQGFTLNI